MTASEGSAVATFAAGCFWCVEAVLEQLDGVQKVVSGYMGGDSENPTYADICTGTTGHAEVTRVTYDPEKVSFVGGRAQLLPHVAARATAHRSHSPPIMLIMSNVGIRSASRPPFTICGSG